MKIDVHSHQIEEIFFDALRALPGVTIKTNPDRFSYLLKDGKTWLPFRPEMFDPDHLIREMDRKGIDISIPSINTPSVNGFEPKTRITSHAGSTIHRRAPQAESGSRARLRERPARRRGVAGPIGAHQGRARLVGIGVGSNFDGDALDDRRL